MEVEAPLNSRHQSLFLTGKERRLDKDEIIVSKTDPQGKITYVNEVFLDISDYEEAEVLGKPHSVIRHPHMPRAIFKLLWDTLGEGKEIFAYVMNRCKNGDHYWVLAHVTPCYTLDGTLLGYHSSRRSPNRQALEKVIPLYDQLHSLEQNAPNRKDGLIRASEALTTLIQKNEMPYAQFVLSL